MFCEINIEDCVPGACHNNGTCIDKVGGYDCLCPAGFVGSRCEGDINECLSNPCSSQGTLDCIQLVNNYHCNCKPGYMGHHCEIKIDFCATSPCQNGGLCSARQNSHHCECPEGFYGKNCQYSCFGTENPCVTGKCEVIVGGDYQCICPPGASGRNCEIDAYDGCNPNPCERGAACQNKLGDFVCFCPPKWSGKTCNKYDSNFKGWSGGNNYNDPDILMIKNDLDNQREQCIAKGCTAKKGNRKCEEECNTYACDFDGGDCTLGVNPWLNCTRSSINCWEVFANGICDEECNNQHCLFDGRDCEKRLRPCHETYDAYCQKHYADGVCNEVCNSAECNWDGLDCEKNHSPKLAEGLISVVVSMNENDFRRQTVPFLRDMGHTLRTNLRIKKDNFGNEMIYPWNARGDLNDLPSSLNPVNAIQVYMEIDNSRCNALPDAECFETAKDAAGFIGASARLQMPGKYKIAQIRAVDSPSDPWTDQQPPGKYVVLGAVIVLMICFILGILITAKRKRAYGQIWRPEGFFTTTRNGQRRVPDGQEMRNLNQNSSLACIDELNANSNGQISRSQQWSDDEQSAPKRSRMYDYDHTTSTDYEEPK